MDQTSDLGRRQEVSPHVYAQLHSHAETAALRPWLRRLLWSLLLLLGLAAADLAALRFHANPMYHLDVGSWGDEALVDGMFAQETDAAGVNYRWTGARSSFHVSGFAAVERPLLKFTVGGVPSGVHLPRPVALRVGGIALVTAPIMTGHRDYELVLPPAPLARGNLNLTFIGPTSIVLPDPRAVGIRLDDIALGWSAGQWVLPTWHILLVQWASVLVWLGIVWRLQLPRRWGLGLAFGLMLLLPIMTATKLLVATPWQMRLLVTSILLLGFAWKAVPLLGRFFPELGSGRELGWLCMLTAAIVTIQLFPVFYPLFGSHDLYIHIRRLQDVQLGSLKLFDTPSEFRGRQTIVPSAFYVLVSPLTLLTATPGPAIQGTYAFLQGTSTLLLAIFVRQLGGSVRAAYLAAFAIAVLPIQVTILWWGFGPQIVGQWFLLLVAVLASRKTMPTPPSAMIGGAALCLAFLMHDGVALLGGAWLGLYVLGLWAFRRRGTKQWWPWGIVLVLCTLIATVLLYSDVVALQLHGLTAGMSVPERIDERTRLLFLVDGLRASFRPLGALLVIACLATLTWKAHTEQRWLVVAWLASGLIFLLIDAGLGLQVRYAYFVMPTVAAGLGLLLDRMMERRPWGWLASWSLVAVIGYSGLTLLYGSILWGFKPLLSALTH